MTERLDKVLKELQHVRKCMHVTAGVSNLMDCIKLLVEEVDDQEYKITQLEQRIYQLEP